MRYKLIILNILALILLYPIITYFIMYDLGLWVEKLPYNTYWIFTQMFVSGPGLIVIGLTIIFSAKSKIIQWLWGVGLTLIGLIWLIEIITTIIKEAA